MDHRVHRTRPEAGQQQRILRREGAHSRRRPGTKRPPRQQPSAEVQQDDGAGQRRDRQAKEQTIEFRSLQNRGQLLLRVEPPLQPFAPIGRVVPQRKRGRRRTLKRVDRRLGGQPPRRVDGGPQARIVGLPAVVADAVDHPDVV